MTEILRKRLGDAHVQGKGPTVRRARLLTCSTSGSHPWEETVGGSLGKRESMGEGARVEG
jgi:hypothetical protein